MAKCEVIEGKQTNWMGLWFHGEYNGFSSQAINLGALKKFKGTVRLYVRKNKFFNKGENGRPNYTFCLKDARSSTFCDIELQTDEAIKPYCKDGVYYTETGERLYTHEEVQYAIDRVAVDGIREYGMNIVSDYLEV